MATVIPMASNPTARRRPDPVRVLAACVALTTAALAGCSGEEAVPIDPANPPVLDAEPPDISHPIQPTPEMEALARRQCVDDPSLDQGYVEAVDPNTDRVLTRITVDCATVRAEG